MAESAFFASGSGGGGCSWGQDSFIPSLWPLLIAGMFCFQLLAILNPGHDSAGGSASSEALNCCGESRGMGQRAPSP